MIKFSLRKFKIGNHFLFKKPHTNFHTSSNDLSLAAFFKSAKAKTLLISPGNGIVTRLTPDFVANTEGNSIQKLSRTSFTHAETVNSPLTHLNLCTRTINTLKSPCKSQSGSIGTVPSLTVTSLTSTNNSSTNNCIAAAKYVRSWRKLFRTTSS